MVHLLRRTLLFLPLVRWWFPTLRRRRRSLSLLCRGRGSLPLLRWRCRIAITLLRTLVALRLRRRIHRSRLRLLTSWFSGPRGLSRRLTLLRGWWRIRPVLWRLYARLLLRNWSRSIRLLRSLAVLNRRRLKRPVLLRL